MELTLLCTDREDKPLGLTAPDRPWTQSCLSPQGQDGAQLGVAAAGTRILETGRLHPPGAQPLRRMLLQGHSALSGLLQGDSGAAGGLVTRRGCSWATSLPRRPSQQQTHTQLALAHVTPWW